MRPEDVGVPAATLVLGKHSGRHAVQRRCEQIGVALGRFELDRVYRAVIALADIQKTVSDDDLSMVVERVRMDIHAEQDESAARGFSSDKGYGHGV
jgi:2-isopropylmalate synthase